MSNLFVVQSRNVDGALKARVYSSMTPVLEWASTFLGVHADELNRHVLYTSGHFFEFAKNDKVVAVHFATDLTDLS